MSQRQPHRQHSAVSAIGGGDWTVTCTCTWVCVRPLLADADAAFAGHVKDERDRAARRVG